MSKIVYLILIVTVMVCTWLVADGDRSRLERWTAQWTAGTIEHSDDLHRRIATLEDNLAYRMGAERQTERYWKRFFGGVDTEISDLRTQLAHAAENEDALMRDLAVALNREPGVLVVHIPVLAHRHAERKHRHQARCLDNIANELNAVEVRR